MAWGAKAEPEVSAVSSVAVDLTETQSEGKSSAVGLTGQVLRLTFAPPFGGRKQRSGYDLDNSFMAGYGCIWLD